MIEGWQDRVLKILAGKADGYCLGGGTALSKVYFCHRQSVDLDFFALKFSRKNILSLMEYLSKGLDKKVILANEQQKKDRIRIMIFNIDFSNKEVLKIDFIEDFIDKIKVPQRINGIDVLSLEDIYLRKLYAIGGTMDQTDLIGRRMRAGGRQEAKDFYDLYFLSHTFMNLSEFAVRYCNVSMQEALVRWFRTYSRMDFKDGILELRTKNKVDYRDIEKHFKKEVGSLLEIMIGKI